MAAKVLQHRRGTTTQHSSFVGEIGEFTYNTDTHSIHVHDGVTVGGHEIMTKERADALYVGGILSGKGVGRGGLNINFSLTYTTAKNGYTVPASGIASFYCELGIDYRLKADVYIDGVKQFTLSPTGSYYNDDAGESDNGTDTYYVEFDMPVIANETIIITESNKTPTQNSGYYCKEFSGTLMQLKVI